MQGLSRYGNPGDVQGILQGILQASMEENRIVPAAPFKSSQKNPDMPPRAPGVLPPARLSQRPWTNFPLSAVQVAVIAGILLVIAAATFITLSGSPLPAGNQSSTRGSENSGILPVAGSCLEGMTLCSGKCVDLLTDQGNCGSCGFSVPYGETCVNGKFSSSHVQKTPGSPTTPAGTQAYCPAGQTSCSGTCRNLMADREHCGSCSITCPKEQDCQEGRCVLPETATPAAGVTGTSLQVFELLCSGREAACGNSCVDLFSDKNNCGVCGRACGSQEICVNARCGPACTESGTTLCDDTCVDLDTDMDNCGSCGTECETFLPNAKGALCTYGECIISGCKVDYADCDRNVANGCEINLRIDANNCGSCGTKCPSDKVCYNKKCSKPIVT